MPQSLSHILIHLVFSTKDRHPFIGKNIQSHLHAYLASVVRDMGCECPRAGGVEDHVHLAIRLSRTLTTAELVEKVKVSSSKWMKTQFSDCSAFSWQRGYGVFSVGPSDEPALLEYIDGQAKHHEKVSFQEEYRRFLLKYGISFDDRYVWD